jgi:ubiquinone/menaquinone biosynthesis C-methylase UbiE
MANFNHFNVIAPVYERFIKPVDPDRIQSLVGVPVSGRLVDIGGGTGRISFMLRDCFTEIFVVDSSMGMLIQALKKGDLHPVCSNSENLPFENESFERVIMVDALHHVGDFRITIAELWRILKPGGRIVIGEPNIQTIAVKLIAIMEKLVLMRSHFISPLVIQESFNFPNSKVVVENAGFTSWVVIDKQSG